MAIDPARIVPLIEEQFGRRVGRFLVKAVVLSAALGIISLGFTSVFQFVGGALWPFFVSIFGIEARGISLDNIEAIIITLVSAIVLFILVLVIVSIAVLRFLRRRIVPQDKIDELADLRSDGIEILNIQPKRDYKTFTVTRKNTWVRGWRERQNRWRERVLECLKTHFTHAEMRSFQRLGLIDRREFRGLALTNEHAHHLMLLAQRIRTLEYLIQFHQERH